MDRVISYAYVLLNVVFLACKLTSLYCILALDANFYLTVLILFSLTILTNVCSVTVLT